MLVHGCGSELVDIDNFCVRSSPFTCANAQRLILVSVNAALVWTCPQRWDRRVARVGLNVVWLPR
jgi:hypothetical protein